MTIAPVTSSTANGPVGTVAVGAAAAAAAATAASKKTASTNDMNGDMFMKLLVTQLTNQDPSSPMDSTQMISQTTQLAMMEKLTELTKSGTENFSLQMRSAAASLLGQQVTYKGIDGADATGTVSAVSYAAGVPVVTVGAAQVSLDAISGVRRTGS